MEPNTLLVANSARSKSIDLPDASRCAFTSVNHRRCRMPIASPDSRYCGSHWRHGKADEQTLCSELEQAAGSLQGPEDVRSVLSAVFRATAQNRIPPRKAAVLGYLGQMLLRAHREVAHRRILDQQEQDSGYIDVRRPIRD
jgi:hypothetical protein